MFADTDINITIEGKRHLGAVVGSRSYTEEYVAGKVEKWTEEIKKLAHIAQTQPRAAYSALHSRSLESLVLSVSNHPGYRGPAKSTGGGYPTTFDPSPNWSPTLLKRGEGPVSSASTSRRNGNYQPSIYITWQL